MGLLQDVLEWSKGLPDWESDAVRRLFEKEKLSDADLEDIIALLKAANGIPDASGRTARPLADDAVPVPPTDGAGTILKSIRHVLHANAIAPGQQLTFAPTGLTVIYGDNGSGKSGYSRILKKACRARDLNTKVLKNAFLPPEKRGIPEAEFEFATDGTAKTARWVYETPFDPELSAIAVFDQHCARTYLDEEHDVSYIPYGLGILIDLAKVLGAIKNHLTTEQKLYAVNKADFSDLQGETAVGRLIASLSAATPTGSVEQLATLSEEETIKQETLEKTLRETDPKGKAKTLGLIKDQLFQLGTSLSTSEKALEDDALLEVRSTVETLAASREAAKLAASALTGQEELLPGTGGVPWKELFKAAKKFSETDAYREQAFPVVSDGSKCVLCQQTLEEGGPRMSRFSAFIQAETEQAVIRAEKAAKDTVVKIAAVKPESALADPALLAEIGTLQEGLSEQIRTFVGSMTSRQKEILVALESGVWPARTETPASPIDTLREIYGKIKGDITELARIAEGEERKKAEAELKELDARLKLSARKTSVVAAIGKFQMARNIAACLGAVNTMAVSGKITGLQKKWLTADLSGALNNEFEALGAEHLRVSFTAWTEGGTPVQKLKLNLSGAGKDEDEISMILSDGEQRILAIASFLAEGLLTHSKSGLVFDDPVSSLDHKYRQNVADRLVREAASRQVVVFTHDVVFLFCLQEACGFYDVPFLPQSLVGNARQFGIVQPNLPFEGKKTKERIKELRELHRQAKELHESGNTAEYAKTIRANYGLLRDSWERMVEEVLLGDVVQRFRRSVETQRLNVVTVNDTDYKTIFIGIKKCSRHEHNPARELQSPVPPPKTFLEDLESLYQYHSSLLKRAEGAKTERKAMLEASPLPN